MTTSDAAGDRGLSDDLAALVQIANGDPDPQQRIAALQAALAKIDAAETDEPSRQARIRQFLLMLNVDCLAHIAGHCPDQRCRNVVWELLIPVIKTIARRVVRQFGNPPCLQDLEDEAPGYVWVRIHQFKLGKGHSTNPAQVPTGKFRAWCKAVLYPGGRPVGERKGHTGLPGRYGLSVTGTAEQS